MYLRLRDRKNPAYLVVDTDTGAVCADMTGRGSVRWADAPDAWGAGRALASAREYKETFARAVPGTRTPDGRFEVRGPVTPAEQATLAGGGAIPDERSALSLHLDFFDPDLDGWISLTENYRGWRALGFTWLGALMKAFFSALFFGRFGARMAIDVTRFKDKRYASTGIFDADGRIDGNEMDKYLAQFACKAGALSFDQVFKLLDQHSHSGVVSRRQFRSLFGLCRRLNGNRDVITKAQFIALFDGSLLWQVASMTNHAGRRARWLQPAGEPA